MKYSSSTYLRDVSEYKLYLYKNDNEVIIIKKIVKIVNPFSLVEFGEEIKLIDNDYYIVEIVNLNDYYICRLFLDSSLNIIEEYYTVTKNNDIKDNIPVYEDLGLSYVKVNGKDKVYHGEKLINDDGYLKHSLEKIMKLNLDMKNLILKIKKVVNFDENSD
ncbi:MAG: hypothetical protein Q4E75_02315 [bacterium]|nr:hypothetical protein [bacterium]